MNKYIKKLNRSRERFHRLYRSTNSVLNLGNVTGVIKEEIGSYLDLKDKLNNLLALNFHEQNEAFKNMMETTPDLETTLGTYLIESIKLFKPGDDINLFKQHLNLIVCKYPNILNFSDDENGCTPLMYAAYRNQAIIVQALIKAGAYVDVRGKNGETPLMMAITSDYRGKIETVQELIDAGADVDAANENGDTPLIMTITSGYCYCEKNKIVRALIKAGADVNVIGKNGYTALMMAITSIFCGKIEIVQALINAGADVDAANENGETLLIVAAYQGYTEIVDALIKAGADLNTQDSKGTTALMLAAERGHTEIARELIESGANVNIQDSEGKTALTYATIEDHKEVVQVLIDTDRKTSEQLIQESDGNKPTED